MIINSSSKYVVATMFTFKLYTPPNISESKYITLHHRISQSNFFNSSNVNLRSTLAGMPATTTPLSVTDLVNTEFAPIIT